ncbi:hypothetical protein ABIC83_002580 [Roseateles asaccharophilus]|uniref:hypothetical protein n=1 Tax=Roseateles asaccharophilus TaxID=582607 RepID=UPI003834693E
MSAPTFATHFSRSLFDDFVEHSREDVYDESGKHRPGPVWDQHLQTSHTLSGRMAKALEAFLNDKRDFGLQKAKFVDGRRFLFVDQWNRFVDEGRLESTIEHERFIDSLSHALLTSNLTLATVLRDPHTDLDATYAQVIDDMDRGNFPWFRTSQRSSCYVTGQLLGLIFKDWEPVVGVLNLKDKDNRLTPLSAPAPEPGVEHHVIQAPSGELLLCDLVDIDAFSKAIRDPAYITEYSLETAAGCLRAAAWSARLGFMSVTVGNTSPHVVKKDGLLTFASVEEKHKVHGEIVGRISTDRWWATAIDREILIDILATKVSRDDAERQVSAYIEEFDVPVVRVRKGQLHLYHTADHEAMNRMACPEVKTSGYYELFAVLSDRELKWTPQQELAESAPVQSSKAPTP